MKNNVIALCIFIAIIALGIIENVYITKTGMNMVDNLERLKTYIINEDYTESGARLKEIEEIWEKADGKWYMTIAHQDLEEIDYTLATLKAYIDGEEKTDAIVDVSKLIQLFETIVDDMKINAYNIL